MDMNEFDSVNPFMNTWIYFRLKIKWNFYEENLCGN